jgi:hypothetical protein
LQISQDCICILYGILKAVATFQLKILNEKSDKKEVFLLNIFIRLQYSNKTRPDLFVPGQGRIRVC